MSVGIPSEVTADNLLGYAYMQPGVHQANLEFNPGSEDGKERPSVTYQVTLEKKFGKRYSAMSKAYASGGIFGKLRVIYLLKKGVPLPGFLEKAIANMAARYLPPNYQVFVNVVK